MPDHLLTFLEQLYNLRMKAGMNVQYHQELADLWASYATWTAVAMIVSAFAGSILTVLSAWKPLAKFVKATRGIAVGLACISVIAGVVILASDMTGKATAYHTAFVQWRDVRGDIERLMTVTAKTSDGDRVPELLSETLAVLKAKVDGIDKSEPEKTDLDRLGKCWTAEVKRTYGVTTDDELDKLRRTDPDRWTQLRYGFVPKHRKPKRKQSSTGSVIPAPSTSRAQISGSTVR